MVIALSHKQTNKQTNKQTVKGVNKDIVIDTWYDLKNQS